MRRSGAVIADLGPADPGKRRASSRDLPELAPDLSAFADPPTPDQRARRRGSAEATGEGGAEEIDAPSPR
jgi:hypothetical protein